MSETTLRPQCDGNAPLLFAPLPAGPFGCILVDPPWRFYAYNGHKIPTRRKVEPYQSMTHDELLAMPIPTIAAKDCALFMWVIDSHLDEALALAKAWGFRFRTCAFVWSKTRRGGWPHVGMGYWTRKQTEQVWLFTRGRPKRLSGGVEQIIYALRGEHSAKPAELYDRIERLVGGPRLELFARQRRPNWTAWGDQIADEGLSL